MVMFLHVFAHPRLLYNLRSRKWLYGEWVQINFRGECCSCYIWFISILCVSYLDWRATDRAMGSLDDLYNPNITYFLSFIVLLSILLSLIIGLRLGLKSLFAVNCSWLHFQFAKNGLWLAIISYVIALINLVVTLVMRKIIKEVERNL